MPRGFGKYIPSSNNIITTITTSLTTILGSAWLLEARDRRECRYASILVPCLAKGSKSYRRQKIHANNEERSGNGCQPCKLNASLSRKHATADSSHEVKSPRKLL